MTRTLGSLLLSRHIKLGALWALAVLVLATPTTFASGGGGTTTTANPVLQSITFSSASVTGGSPATGLPHFSGTTNGAVVQLVSSNPAVAQVPASTIFPGTQGNGAFPITTSPVAAPTEVTITGTSFGVTVSATLTVVPGPVAAPDTVRILKAESAQGILRIEATSSNPNAILTVFTGPSHVRMFNLANDGTGHYTIQRAWDPAPASIFVESNFGGSATAPIKK